MAPRKSGIKFVAKIVTENKLPCAFCNSKVDDELLYGKLYAIGDIHCHYYCVLLSSCLIQKGKDDHGLFGFMYDDILAEIERCKKHKCSYCNQIGANLGCSVAQCRKQFHLPCGREKNSVSLFYGNYKTFCQQHVPRQKIPDSIMTKAKARKQQANKVKKSCHFKDLKKLSLNESTDDTETQSVCVICYEPVEGYPTVNTFWPPCCARDAWFHRTCLQRMSLSAGMHYLKCPLCNDKENFYEAVVSQGYYVPDRDAAWELEQNAFAEIYERQMSCSAIECACPMGRSHDAESGAWNISVCVLCGSAGWHARCGGGGRAGAALHICDVCAPAAPADLDRLATSIEAVISQEQAQTSSRRRRGPVMPCRMSLRRTKQNFNSYTASSSTSLADKFETGPQTTSNTTTSRNILNLKPPRKRARSGSSPLKLVFSPSKIDSRSPKYESPTKLLEESIKKKFGPTGVEDALVDELKKRFRRPQPLSFKRKILNDVLNGLFDNILQDRKQKEPLKLWFSPKKCNEDNEDVILVPETPPIVDLTENSKEETPIYAMYNTPKKLNMVDFAQEASLEISANDEIINIDVIKQEKPGSETIDLYTPTKCSFKFSPCNKELINDKNMDYDLETFKNQYLSEVTAPIHKKKMKKLSKKRKMDKEKIVLELESKKKKLKRRTISIKNRNIQVKIKWREERLNLKFDDLKTNNRKKKNNKKFKQYVLKYSPKKDAAINTVLSKPDVDVTPRKRKYVKQEKTPDNLIQTSIDKFFKVKTPS